MTLLDAMYAAWIVTVAPRSFEATESGAREYASSICQRAGAVKEGTLVRAFYYTAVTEDQEFSSVRPLLDWLDYNGFSVVTKPTKEFVDANGHRKVKGNMDIELTVDAMELADRVDHIVLFSGDGDFRSLVEALQRRGVRVTVVSTISIQPPMIADELRRQADVFTDLTDLHSRIGRDPLERPTPREASLHSHYVHRRTSLKGGQTPGNFKG